MQVNSCGRCSSGVRLLTETRARRNKSRPCYCYILECADGTFYTGWAMDPGRRLETHNAGRGARYTRARRPVKLVYLEPQPDRVSAMKRERAPQHTHCVVLCLAVSLGLSL